MPFVQLPIVAVEITSVIARCRSADPAMRDAIAAAAADGAAELLVSATREPPRTPRNRLVSGVVGVSPGPVPEATAITGAVGEKGTSGVGGKLIDGIIPSFTLIHLGYFDSADAQRATTKMWLVCAGLAWSRGGVGTEPFVPSMIWGPSVLLPSLA